MRTTASLGRGSALVRVGGGGERATVGLGEVLPQAKGPPAVLCLLSPNKQGKEGLGAGLWAPPPPWLPFRETLVFPGGQCEGQARRVF